MERTNKTNYIQSCCYEAFNTDSVTNWGCEHAMKPVRVERPLKLMRTIKIADLAVCSLASILTCV